MDSPMWAYERKYKVDNVDISTVSEISFSITIIETISTFLGYFSKVVYNVNFIPLMNIYHQNSHIKAAAC